MTSIHAAKTSSHQTGSFWNMKAGHLLIKYCHTLVYSEINELYLE
jgi:hypothetical protein